MKTRFRIAITHELPGADFQSAAGESRRAFRMPRNAILAACVRNSPSSHPAPIVNYSHADAPGWWRFASTWREKPIDNLIATPERKRFFRRLTTGLAAAA